VLAPAWTAIAAGFLVEKANRTGSRRTTEVYGRMLARFLHANDPGRVGPLEVHRFAYALRADGRPPAPSTISVRLAAISGFYDFACRMQLAAANPAENVRRPRARLPLPRGLSRPEVVRLLAAIPYTPSGLVDRAIVITAILTGLRRSELFAMRLVVADAGPVRYEVRTKGGAVRRRALPEPAGRAIAAAAKALPSHVGEKSPFPIAAATFYSRLRRHGEVAGLGRISPHTLRHTAAKLRRDAGASLEDVSAFLGHRSLATTAAYLCRLEDEHDEGWQAVAAHLNLNPSPVGDGQATATVRAERAVLRGGEC
jgi:integrase